MGGCPPAWEAGMWEPRMFTEMDHGATNYSPCLSPCFVPVKWGHSHRIPVEPGQMPAQKGV